MLPTDPAQVCDILLQEQQQQQQPAMQV